MTRPTIRTLASGLAACLAANTHAQTTGFWLVGLPPGGTNGDVRALSRDGTIAMGYSNGMPGYSLFSFRWTETGGRDDWGTGPGMPSLNAVSCVDESGTIVAGGMSWGPFRRAGEGPIENLGVLPEYESMYVNGISGDGSVIVGKAIYSVPNKLSSSQAYRWTAAGGLQSLGKLNPNDTDSEASGISRDGTTIVGTAEYGIAFMWTQSTGMKALKPLAGGSSSARAVNADGTVIVGSSKSVGAFTHACRWVNGQPEDLSSAAIQQNGLAYAVSDDGTVIGGQIGFNFPGSAFVWTKGLGMLEATDYLALHGVTVPSGYKLENVYAISGDGLTFGGVARDLTTTKREGWVARVTSTPLCAADCNANGLLDIDDFICFQTLFVLNEPQADCDGNVAINIDDFECFQTLFALGC